jgi:hypothetical protein
MPPLTTPFFYRSLNLIYNKDNYSTINNKFIADEVEKKYYDDEVTSMPASCPTIETTMERVAARLHFPACCAWCSVSAQASAQGVWSASGV